MHARLELLAVIGFTLLLGSACASNEPPPEPARAVPPKATPLPVVSEKKMPADQRTILAISGTYCEFYLVDAEAAILNVPGVKDVDFKTMKGHAIVTYVAGRMNPNHLLAAVRSVKGDGYYCKARVENEGVGGKVIR